jgi:hypothetical protein
MFLACDYASMTRMLTVVAHVIVGAGLCIVNQEYLVEHLIFSKEK